jgi:DNA-binding CsgD family transcriptional regulator
MQNPAATDRRRWDDRPGALPALTFARFLTTSPTLPEAMRFLVGMLSWPVGAYGALLLCPHHDGITICARFEQSIDDTATRPIHEDVVHQVTEAVREVTAGQSVVWTAPDTPDRIPMAAWPLGIEADHSRVLVVLLAAAMDPVVFTQRTIGVPEGLGVYLAGVNASVSLPRLGPAPKPADVHLTQRQVQVLELLAQGLTLHQIAGRIGFSESTVRMESLAIYRALDVHGRDSAVNAACELGILPRLPDPST